MVSKSTVLMWKRLNQQILPSDSWILEVGNLVEDTHWEGGVMWCNSRERVMNANMYILTSCPGFVCIDKHMLRLKSWYAVIT